MLTTFKDTANCKRVNLSSTVWKTAYTPFTPEGVILHRISLDMPYALRMRVATTMYYGDAKGLRVPVNMYYEDTPQLRKAVVMKYEDALPHRISVELPYVINSPIRVPVEIPYVMAETSHRIATEMEYSINSNIVHRVSNELVYLMLDNTNVFSNSTSVEINGVTVPVSSVSLKYSIHSFVAVSSVTLTDLSDYLSISHGDPAAIIKDGVRHEMVVVSDPTRSRNSPSDTTYSVVLNSPCIKLSAPWSKTFTCSFDPDTGRNIFEFLAQPFTVYWEVPDFPIEANTLSAGNEDNITVMRRIAESMGAKIQPNPDGSIRVTKRRSVTTNTIQSAPPDYYLTDHTNFISQSESFKHSDGYNVFDVRSTESPNDSIRLENDGDSRVLMFEVPWKDTPVRLEHSGGSSPDTPVYLGVVTETYPPLTENPERLEFVAGFATTAKPVYGGLQVDWIRENLGSITYSEDGRVECSNKTGPTDGYSLADVRYTTKYKLWKVNNGAEPDVQYILRVLNDDEDSSQPCN